MTSSTPKVNINGHSNSSNACVLLDFYEMVLIVGNTGQWCISKQSVKNAKKMTTTMLKLWLWQWSLHKSERKQATTSSGEDQ